MASIYISPTDENGTTTIRNGNNFMSVTVKDGKFSIHTSDPEINKLSKNKDVLDSLFSYFKNYNANPQLNAFVLANMNGV